MPAAALSAADIISAIEFDKTGEQLATGDRGGRVVLFQRQDNKPDQQVLGPGAHIACGLTSHLMRAMRQPHTSCKIYFT